jgi:hypothetical protein
MPIGKIKHAFPGGNTSQGFFSYYDYILEQDDATRVFIIKGGPGVGKSTFMKKVADEMLKRDYDVEFMHCSSDSNSLDGLVIPEIKIALLDGTAPHVVDPKIPGAVDEIIYLGDYWTEEGIRPNKQAIMRDSRDKGRFFARAYKYLRAALTVYEDTAVINSWAIDTAKVNFETTRIIDAVFAGDPIADKEGRQRKLFASAITPDGLKNYLTSIISTERIYVIRGNPGTGTEKILEKIMNEAIERGYFVELYYCALLPTKLEHIVIPQKGVAFTTSNEYHHADVAVYEEINLNEYLDKNIIKANIEALEYNGATFDALLNRAVETISKARDVHDKMESYYIPYMDFEAVQICRESTVARILAYAKEHGQRR